MTRDYDAMRAVLATAARGDRPSKYGDLWSAVRDESVLRSELASLGRDGLLDNGFRFQGGDGCCLGGEASITEEGCEFLRLIENEGFDYQTDWHWSNNDYDEALFRDTGLLDGK